jgi:hypothetical protein
VQQCGGYQTGATDRFQQFAETGLAFAQSCPSCGGANYPLIISGCGRLDRPEYSRDSCRFRGELPRVERDAKRATASTVLVLLERLSCLGRRARMSPGRLATLETK